MNGLLFSTAYLFHVERDSQQSERTPTNNAGRASEEQTTGDTRRTKKVPQV